MKKETQESSPFAALTYQEQQDRWLEWRSRQLDFRPAPTEETPPPSPPRSPLERPAPPTLQLPYFRQAAPTRHMELDRVLSRHAQASKRTGAFQTASPGPDKQD